MTDENKEKEENHQENSVSEPSASAKGSAWGYDMYPDRRGNSVENSWYNILTGSVTREMKLKLHCEKNVFNVLQNSPIVNLMVSALSSSGCAIDIQRHFSCENCEKGVTGGYDPQLNQVVICQNAASNCNIVQSVLVHEMIHMFDYCRNELDFRNIDHLACTEVRAANLTHCSFLSAWQQGATSPFNVKGSHQECVKQKAVSSVMTARGVSKEEARAAVDRVFSKCYNDLEPIGRRIRRNSYDMQKAIFEAPYYGYNT